MGVFRDIRDAVIAKLGTAWGAAGTVLLFVAPIASLAFRGHVPPEIDVMLPFIVFLSVAAFLFFIWLAWYVWQTVFADAEHVHVPDLETIVYTAYPYNADSHLRALSAFAHKAFHGDTISADIVQYAVAKKCAAGMRLTNAAGRDIGFFDVFRLRSDALQRWLDGTLPETDLKETDFEPLARPVRKGETLELIIGAIYIEPKTAKAEPSLAFQLAEVAQNQLWKACPGWHQVRLYSSIFTDSGERLAELYGFTKSVYKEDRKGAGADHDVWVRTIRRADPPRVVRGLGGRHNLIMQVKNA